MSLFLSKKNLGSYLNSKTEYYIVSKSLWLRDLAIEKAKYKKCKDGSYKRFESAVQGGAQLYCIGRNPFKEILPYYFANIAHGTTGGFAKVFLSW